MDDDEQQGFKWETAYTEGFSSLLYPKSMYKIDRIGSKECS